MYVVWFILLCWLAYHAPLIRVVDFGASQLNSSMSSMTECIEFHSMLLWPLSMNIQVYDCKVSILNLEIIDLEVATYTFLFFLSEQVSLNGETLWYGSLFRYLFVKQVVSHLFGSSFSILFMWWDDENLNHFFSLFHLQSSGRSLNGLINLLPKSGTGDLWWIMNLNF